MRCGGDHRGSSYCRRARKRWLLREFGDGRTCRCVHCGGKLTYETVTSDRIDIGGSYARDNVQPACQRCNRARWNNPEWVFA